MERFRLERTAKTHFIYIIAGIIFISLILPIGCSKEELTAPVSFKPPGVYSGTYYVLRDWQTPNEDMSLANITIDFKGDLTYIMTVNSVTPESQFRPCSVNGSYVFRGDSLTFTYTNNNPNPHQEICDPSVGPLGVFEYSVVQNTLMFISRGTDYRKIELAGK